VSDTTDFVIRSDSFLFLLSSVLSILQIHSIPQKELAKKIVIFPSQLSRIVSGETYFQNITARDVMARNQRIEMVTTLLSNLMEDRPEYWAEARQEI